MFLARALLAWLALAAVIGLACWAVTGPAPCTARVTVTACRGPLAACRP